MRARLYTCSRILIAKKLAPSKLEIGTYTTDAVRLVGSWMFYLVHLDTKCLQEVTLYLASNNGSVLSSCTTFLSIGLIQPCTQLDYLPPRASLITSSPDHPKKTKSKINVCVPKKESELPNHKDMVSKLITSKDQIIANYVDVFDGIGCYPGPPYHIQVISSVTLKLTNC